MSTVDREIGPKGYDPYCHNPYAPEDEIAWHQPVFTDHILWLGKDGRVRRITARSPVPVRLLGMVYA